MTKIHYNSVVIFTKITLLPFWDPLYHSDLLFSYVKPIALDTRWEGWGKIQCKSCKTCAEFCPVFWSALPKSLKVEGPSSTWRCFGTGLLPSGNTTHFEKNQEIKMVRGQELCFLEVHKSTNATGNLVSAQRGHVKFYLAASFSGPLKFRNHNNFIPSFDRTSIWTTADWTKWTLNKQCFEMQHLPNMCRY